MASSHFELLGLDFEAGDDGRLEGGPTGPLGEIFRQEFEDYVGKLNKGKVLARRRGGNVYSLYQPPQPSKAGMRVIAHRMRRKLLGQIVPSTATMSVTYACQCDCTHCSAKDYRAARSGREEISIERFKDVIDQTLDLGVVNIALSGGEPLLRKGVFELIDHVDPERANVMLFSNGWLLTEENVKRLAASNLFALMVSLDSSDGKTHDGLRRSEGLFDKLVAGVKRSLDAGLLVGLSTYATREDIASGEIEKRVALARELGVHEITIFDPVPTGCLLNHEEIVLEEGERQVLVELAEKYNAQEGLPKVSPQALINSPRGAGCFAGYHQFYMTAYGDICPCDFTPLTFGNVNDESLEKIWTRLIAHPGYRHRRGTCRMQDRKFREIYIDSIPDGAPLPFDMRDNVRRIGVVAGAGEFPLYFASRLKERGYEVCVISIEEEATGPALEAVADHHEWVKVGEFGRAVEIFRDAGVRDVVMVGKVHKSRIYTTGVEMDDRLKKVFASVKIKDDLSLLHAIGSEMEAEGLRICEPSSFLPGLYAEKGTLTEREPTKEEWADIEYGFTVAKKMAELGIGQTVVLKGGAVIAVEALEGTDRTILRSGELTQGGTVVAKVSAPDHDLRYDAPVIGIDTIATLSNSGATVLAVEAGKVVLLGRERVLAKADERGISIVGV